MVRDSTSALWTVVLLLATVPAGGGAVADAPPFLAQEGFDPDDVTLGVSLRADGSANWTVTYRTRLDDDNATAAFESLAADVRANRSRFTDRFGDRMRRTAAAAENATGREMAIRAVSVRTTRQEIGQQYGAVIYAFVWEEFAVADGSRLRAGDAIAGLFLDPETTLRVTWPRGYRAVDISPPPDERPDRTAVWQGRQDFGPDAPRIELATAGAPATVDTPTTGATVTTAPPTTTGDTPPAGGEGAGLLPAAVIATVVLLALVLAAGWLYRSREEPPSKPEGEDGAAEESPPEELLSNEERVLRLLREHGGRMKQQQVAEELGWTDAKTSQVVGELRESGDVDGFRLGRENVLTLPDENDT